MKFFMLNVNLLLNFVLDQFVMCGNFVSISGFHCVLIFIKFFVIIRCAESAVLAIIRVRIRGYLGLISYLSISLSSSLLITP